MQFDASPRGQELRKRLQAFMDDHVHPNEAEYLRQVESGRPWVTPELVEDLKVKARSQGLWNLFLPDSEHGAGLSNFDYAPLAELMGAVPWASEVFNCSAPDTGNMEVLVRYGTAEQKERWLQPLLAGEIRSCFAMTEPAVASSDATNIECRIERKGDDYLINGRKWWLTGAPNKRCAFFIVMGKTDAAHPDRFRQQSMILVPRNAAGITVERSLKVLGYDDQPHGHAEVTFENVRVPVSNVLLGEGRGFEIAQGRLGPGRIHHCMRLIGLSERALRLMCKRATERVAFGKPLAEQTVTLERIAESRIMIDQARLLTMRAAWMMDTVGNKSARAEIAMIKVAVPNMAQKVIDWSIQLHGSGGLCQDFSLAYAYSRARLLRLADGPDEVHRNQVGRLELKRSSRSANLAIAA